MSTSVLKALPGKLDIKRHSPSILYLLDTDDAVTMSDGDIMMSHVVGFFS